MSRALRDGVLPVRWMPDAAYGLGYPVYRYYAALPYYVASAFDLSGFGVLWGIRLAQLLGFLLAGGMAYLLARQMALGPPAALFASALYTLAPFHLVNVYVRGDSLSEFYAMGLFPLVLWAFSRLRQRPSPARAVVAALGYAALVLSHNISALIFSPFAALWVLLGTPLREQRGWKWLAWASGAAALGLALSAWFWIPALGEQHLAQLGEQTTGFFHYAGHFRGADMIQTRLVHAYAIGDGRDPFNMGLLQAFVALAGLGSAVALAIRRRLPATALWAVMTLLAATAMITPLSRPVWDRLPLLPFVQFPWRFLSIQALAVALLGGLLLWRAPRRVQLMASLVGCAMAGIAGLVGLEIDRLPLREADITTQRLMLYETYSGNVGGTVRYEYLPREMVPRPYVSAVQLNGGIKPTPLILTGRIAHVELLSQRTQSETWEIVVDEPSQLAFHTACTAGWRARANGQKTPIECLPGLGLIGLRLEPGSYRIELALRETPLGRIACVISVIALAVAAIGTAPTLCASRRRRIAALAGVGALGLWIAWVTWLAPSPTRTEASGLLVMDTLRAPYLHHENEPVSLGAVRLLGCRLGQSPRSAGDTLEIELDWDWASEAHRVQLVLVGATAHLFDDAPAWAQIESAIARPHMALSLRLPDAIPPGLYVLRVHVFLDGKDQPPRTARGLELARLALAPLQVIGSQGATGQERVLGSFGPPYEPPVISLVGAEPVSRGEREIQVSLTWRSERQAAVNYALSLRLLRSDGSQIAARDLPPMLGGYPTSLWKPGEVLSDRVIVRWQGEPVGLGYGLEIVLYDLYTMRAAGTVRLLPWGEKGAP
jgi:hypothetical protein